MPGVETMAPAALFFLRFFLIPSGGIPGVTAVDGLWTLFVYVLSVLSAMLSGA